MKTHLLTNKRMNSEVYALRRKVIDLIHEAKRLAPLPRIEVRVTENQGNRLGCAAMGDCQMWITERAVVSRATVFHEILHAVFAQSHVVGCPLMATHIDPNLDKETCDKLFKKYAHEKR